MPRRDTDPYGAYNFLVEIEGVNAAGFSEVSGLGAEIEVISYREGGDVTHIRKLPGLTKFSNVTLKRGVTASDELWTWFEETAQGNIERRTVVIILLDEARNPVVRWELFGAWPCALHLGALQAATSEIAIETLELVYERLRRAD